MIRPNATNQFLTEDEPVPTVKLRPRRTNKFACYVGTTATNYNTIYASYICDSLVNEFGVCKVYNLILY